MEAAARREGSLILAASLLLGALAVAGMWSRPVDEAAVLSVILIFSTVPLTCYYWILLILVPLAGDRWLPTAGVLATSALAFGFRLDPPVLFERTYGAMSWALLAMFVVWAGTAAVHSVRETGKAAPRRGGRRALPR